MSEPLLEVQGLSTHFDVRGGTVRAVDGVSFSLGRGEVLGLVGESGSGKSQTGYSIMGLVDPPGKVVAGSIRFEGRELVGLPSEQLRALRGNRMAMIFQDPMMTLNPVLRIGTQMAEAVLAHRKVGRARALEEAHHALERVGIPSAGERLRSYPHQLSGGMRQRVVIAIALLNSPKLFIADEPTTALDVTIQGQILYEMQKLTRETGASLIWITHDLAVVAALAQRICVMHKGKIVEQGDVDQVLRAPVHPYTRGLMDSIPSRNPRGQRLRTMPAFEAP
ncbi:ABC transporter ATP-binding protein [Ramlibacter sp. G-1-2-2]|uniref:ABC transporter ATP-binding protein n=1 Tax=Ramlibacter agri TaxID=2728837 RepID=A0A848HHC5_9BURK|nr:ABC transporter ATP-binding protein [Ramlibacter agri]NML47078.1 ABC transporter ATP-binding protein [Ramlibacter agri]